MSDIHKNLKQLRIAKNFTQEEVAGKIGVTRQAISSYESGRTQPGIDLLMKFAEIYEVELKEVLYGKRSTNIEMKRIKVIAAITISLWLIFRIMDIVLTFISHTVYAVEKGAVSDSMPGVLDMHFKYLDAADLFEGLSYDALLLGGLVLLVLDLIMKNPINMKDKWKNLCILSGISILIGVIGTIMVPLYRGNFMLTARFSIYIMVLFMIVDVIGQKIKNLFRFNTSQNKVL